MPSWECKVSSFICAEVDLILGDAEIALEIKSSENVPGRTKGLHLFNEEHKCRKSFIISRDPLPRKISSNSRGRPRRGDYRMRALVC